MSMFDGIAKLLGLQSDNQAVDAPEQAPPTATASGGSGVGQGISSNWKNDPYDALWLSIEKHLEAFMAQRVAPHLKYEPNDVFRLERVQIQAQNPAADDILNRFLDEFRPDSRRRAFLERLRRTCAHGVSTDAFVDFNRDFEAALLEQSDPFLAALQQNISGGYEVILYGAWVLEEREPVRGERGLGGGNLGAQLHVDIHDAMGQRKIDLQVLPVTLGRTPGSQGCEVRGKFVSRKHGVIDRDPQGRVWYRDVSANGTFVNGVQILPGQQYALEHGAVLRLGADSATNSFDDCPQLKVDWEGGAGDDATPLRQPINAADATPIRVPSNTPVMASTSTVLCLLAVQDAEGSRTEAVMALPYRVGRANNSDYRAPEANLGVSREHLVIARLDQQGAEIHSTGTWGTAVDGLVMPECFTLRYGQTMVLASNYASAPVVTIELLRP